MQAEPEAVIEAEQPSEMEPVMVEEEVESSPKSEQVPEP